MVLSHLFIDLWLISLIYDWSPPAGGGIRTRDLVVESRVQDHWAIPVIPSKWYPKYPLVQTTKKNKPTPSEFTQHLQNLPITFRIHPPPSEFTHHLQNSPTTFRKNMFWGRWTFLDLFPKIPRSKKRRFWQKWVFWKNIMNYPKGHELSFDLTYLMDLLSAHLDRQNAKKY